MIGSFVFSVKSLINSFIWMGPKLQFIPSASTPSPSKIVVIVSIFVPVKLLADSSYTVVTKIGTSNSLPKFSITSLQAIIPAFAS